ncbi:flavin reductase family protein [uncultured Williamsia sp.]|uniref:flavin reductase family protein n=1 Tax=uncultured Williamsia sp. TaxID=259311 RepID=UPI00260731CC|nr:flavin reductase family protein [uncultured Williamsia sp.]
MSADDITGSDRIALLSPDPATMRSVLGHFCTGVAVITGSQGGRPLGFACQSVTSVSLDPPYVSFCPSLTSTSWPPIRAGKALCINVLADDQRAVCDAFARSGGDKFVDVSWWRGDNGAPVLAGALATIEAEFVTDHEAGDHTIAVARVTGLHADADRSPLLFFQSSYGTFGPSASD